MTTMLNHRTNVLLDEQSYQLLTKLAREQKITVGNLIRSAISKVYRKDKAGISQKQQYAKLRKKLKQGWKLLRNPHIPLDYRALVTEGRKYED